MEGHTGFSRPQPPYPSGAGCWEEAQLCPWARWGRGFHLSSSDGGIAMRGQRLEGARLQERRERGGPRPLTSQLDTGEAAGGGNQALKPLALTSHLHGLMWGVLPSSRVGWIERPEQTSGPSAPPPPAPSLESAFLTVCATWGPPRVGGGCGAGGGGWGALGWPPMPGVGLGVICIETSPKPGGCGRASRERAGRGPRLPDAPSLSIRHMS